MKFIAVAVPLFLSAFATAAPEAAQEKRQRAHPLYLFTSPIDYSADHLALNAVDGLGGDLTAGIGGLTSAVGAGAASLSANGEGLGFTILGTGPNSVLTAAVALGTSTFTLVTTQGGQGYTLGAGGADSAVASVTGAADSIVASATAAAIPSGFTSSVQSVVSSVSTESVASVRSTSAGGAAPTSGSDSNSNSNSSSSAAASVHPSKLMLYAAGVMGSMVFGAMSL
ncbi:unnamed protein product [Peniophora sp. CBMAI 1063]|nr:unnamed protein product [Peniophora sp. CBMAI 1063]